MRRLPYLCHLFELKKSSAFFCQPDFARNILRFLSFSIHISLLSLLSYSHRSTGHQILCFEPLPPRHFMKFLLSIIIGSSPTRFLTLRQRGALLALLWVFVNLKIHWCSSSFSYQRPLRITCILLPTPRPSFCKLLAQVKRWSFHLPTHRFLFLQSLVLQRVRLVNIEPLLAPPNYFSLVSAAPLWSHVVRDSSPLTASLHTTTLRSRSKSKTASSFAAPTLLWRQLLLRYLFIQSNALL